MKKVLIICFLSGFLSFTTWGSVVDSSCDGFTVRHVVTIGSLPDAVYEHLVSDVGKWWDSEHTWSGDAICTVGGYTPSGLQKIAIIVDQVLGQQVTRLKSYIHILPCPSDSGR